MLKLGNQNIAALRLGGTEIKKAYLGGAVVFDVSEPPVPTYTVSASIDPAGSGTVSGAGTYQAGETVTVTAVPEECYQFTGWQENGVVVSEDAVYTFVVAGDRTLVAVFEEVDASLLPEGYTQLEYIYVPYSGTYNANYRPYLSIPATSGAVKFEIKAACNRVSASLTSLIAGYGSKSGSYYSRYGLCFGGKFWSASYNIPGVSGNANLLALMGGTSSSSAATIGILKTTVDTPYTIVLRSGSTDVYVNDVPYTSAKFSTKAWYASAVTLFQTSNADWSIGELGQPVMNMYYAKWYDTDGNVLRHLVPCKDPSGVVGMYDAIGKVFYKSANTSTNAANAFSAGPAV